MQSPRIGRATIAALVLALCTACLGGKNFQVPVRYSAEEVPAAVEQARAEIEEPGGSEAAVERMRVAALTPGLDAGLRVQVQRLLESAVEQRIVELESSGSYPKDLQDLSELAVARRLAVRAGIASARAWRDKQERVKCFRQIRSLDERFPLHSLRGEAGELLAEVGLSLAYDKRTYGWFFRYRALAPQILEYLVTEYPSDPRGAEALTVLAGIYEDSNELDLALQRHEDLLLYFPEDEAAPISRASIPRIRLAKLASPEYDRSAMEEARLEIDEWLSNFPNHPHRPEMELLLVDCLGRLADNDLVVARFYDTVGSPTGSEYHARRALGLAREAGSPRLIEDATATLAKAVSKQDGEAQ